MLNYRSRSAVSTRRTHSFNPDRLVCVRYGRVTEEHEAVYEVQMDGGWMTDVKVTHKKPTEIKVVATAETLAAEDTSDDSDGDLCVYNDASDAKYFTWLSKYATKRSREQKESVGYMRTQKRCTKSWKNQSRLGIGIESKRVREIEKKEKLAGADKFSRLHLDPKLHGANRHVSYQWAGKKRTTDFFLFRSDADQLADTFLLTEEQLEVLEIERYYAKRNRRENNLLAGLREDLKSVDLVDDLYDDDGDDCDSVCEVFTIDNYGAAPRYRLAA